MTANRGTTIFLSFRRGVLDYAPPGFDSEFKAYFEILEYLFPKIGRQEKIVCESAGSFCIQETFLEKKNFQRSINSCRELNKESVFEVLIFDFRKYLSNTDIEKDFEIDLSGARISSYLRRDEGRNLKTIRENFRSLRPRGKSKQIVLFDYLRSHYAVSGDDVSGLLNDDPSITLREINARTKTAEDFAEFDDSRHHRELHSTSDGEIKRQKIVNLQSYRQTRSRRENTFKYPISSTALDDMLSDT
ncbi:MAG: hypothetical protein AAFX86_15260 [Pseudomonadota bacterium]